MKQHLNITPFFSKGKGRSIMLSMFMIQHDENDIFQLDENEWNEAVNEFPTLKEKVERLFILLKFKKAFKSSQDCKVEIEIMVDNATTHSAKVYDIHKFGLRPKQTANFPYEAEMLNHEN